MKRIWNSESVRSIAQVIKTCLQNECEYMKRVAEKATRAVVVAQRAVESERHKNQNLRRRLRDSDALIVRMILFLFLQFVTYCVEWYQQLDMLVEGDAASAKEHVLFV